MNNHEKNMLAILEQGKTEFGILAVKADSRLRARAPTNCCDYWKLRDAPA